MRKIALVVMAGGTLLSGCATQPENVIATYVSPSTFASYNCKQIISERNLVIGKVNELTGAQEKKANDDAVAVNSYRPFLASSFSGSRRKRRLWATCFDEGQLRRPNRRRHSEGLFLRFDACGKTQLNVCSFALFGRPQKKSKGEPSRWPVARGWRVCGQMATILGLFRPVFNMPNAPNPATTAISDAAVAGRGPA